MSSHQIFQHQVENYITIGEQTVQQRLTKLKKLEKVFDQNRQNIKDALYKDHKKTFEETDLIDILPVKHEFREVRNHLYHWASPKAVTTPLLLFGSTSKIVRESKGVVLLISPWNFPINLTFVPLISALAAGNCVMIKPSEFTPHASAIIKAIITEVYEDNEVAVIEGSLDTSKELLSLPFHHIFFTGSSNVGKKVMIAAAENLSSITLELGGKSPCIIDETAEIKTAARRLAMIKYLVNGQICITTDYALVHENVAREFADEMLKAIKEFMGENAEESKNYSRIINSKQHQRLVALIKEATLHGDEVITDTNTSKDHYLSPTVIITKSEDSPLLKDEIFGPILPIKTFKTLEEAIQMIQDKPRPLALYIFSKRRKNIQRIISQTRAGATVVNNTGIHHFNTKFPFGGVNNSGIGKSHGEWGFNEFSNLRPIIKSHSKWSTLELLFPPYNSRFKKWLVNFATKHL